MKKAIFLFAALILCLSLYACGSKVTTNTGNTRESSKMAAEASTDPVNADWEIITRDGHPRYYGSTSEAHKL